MDALVTRSGKGSPLTNAEIDGNMDKLATSKVETRSVTIENPSYDEDITLFYTTKALTVLSVRAVVKGSSPNITYSIKSASDRSAGSPTVNVNAEVVTNTTTGANATLANANIAANTWVWLTTSAKSGTVTSLNITFAF